MPISGQPPVGFCPHCHYPIDPGICSECGEEVSPEEILTSHGKLLVRRRRRWLLSIGVFAALFVGTWIAFKYFNWHRWVPAVALVTLQGGPEHWTTRELLARFAGGSLSTKNACRFVDRATVTTFSVKNPGAVMCTLPYSIDMHLEVPRSASTVLNVSYRMLSLKVDGAEQLIGGSSGCIYGGSGRSRTSSYLYGLQEGGHEIEVSMQFDATVTGGIASGSATNPVSFIRNFKKGTVLDSKIADSIVAECTPDQIAEMSHVGVSLGDGPNSSSSSLLVEITSARLSIPLAGRLRLFNNETQTSEEIGSVVVGVGQETVQQYSVHSDRNVPSLEVHYIPDRCAAASNLAYITRYYDCPIIWKAVPNRNVANPAVGPTFPSSP